MTTAVRSHVLQQFSANGVAAQRGLYRLVR
jgi:hypothetical protein